MRYMGTKYNLLEFLIPHLKTLIDPGKTFVDLMSGTNSVSYAMKPFYKIISNDIQEYTRHIGIALIKNNYTNITYKDYEKDISDNISNNFTHDLFLKYYKNTYFSKKQCVDIDNIRYAIDRVNDKTKKSLYFISLFYAMGYAQLTTGHFAQYLPNNHPRIKPLKSISILKTFKKRVLENKIIFSNFKNEVYTDNYRKLLDDKNLNKLNTVGLIYVDPPYSSAQYSRFYHILETVTKYDYPIINYKGKYRSDRFQSDFCYKDRVLKEFDFIFQQAYKIGSNVAVSYSTKGIANPGDIANIAKRYFRKTAIFSKAYHHSKLGSGIVRDINEILISAS